MNHDDPIERRLRPETRRSPPPDAPAIRLRMVGAAEEQPAVDEIGAGPDAIKALHRRATLRLAAALGGGVSDR